MPPASGEAQCSVAGPDTVVSAQELSPKGLQGLVKSKGIEGVQEKGPRSLSPGITYSPEPGQPGPDTSFPPFCPIRAETLGHRPISGDEHSLPLLVLLPPRSLQQKNV